MLNTERSPITGKRVQLMATCLCDAFYDDVAVATVDAGLKHIRDFFTRFATTEAEHEKLAKGTRVTEVRNVLGRRVEIQGEITEFDEDRRLTFSGKGPAVKRLEYEYVLKPDAGGTRLDTEIEVELSDLFGIASGVITRLASLHPIWCCWTANS